MTLGAAVGAYTPQPADKTVSRAYDVPAPTLHDNKLLPSNLPWRLMDGYSGQYGYSGPMMHQSEFIGGGMALSIINTPGLYVAVVDFTEDNPTEWAVAYIHDED